MSILVNHFQYSRNNGIGPLCHFIDLNLDQSYSLANFQVSSHIRNWIQAFICCTNIGKMAWLFDKDICLICQSLLEMTTFYYFIIVSCRYIYMYMQNYIYINISNSVNFHSNSISENKIGECILSSYLEFLCLLQGHQQRSSSV